MQNRKIHEARAQIGMELDDCRELARQIGGKASISALSFEQRSELIEELKLKGADVYNPRLPKTHAGPEDLYSKYLDLWNKRFPSPRPGFASTKQLAWIQALWDRFSDGRTDKKKGLRGFLFRQTKSLEQGPVSDLAFLRENHVEAVITPLKEKAPLKKGKKKSPRRRLRAGKGSG